MAIPTEDPIIVAPSPTPFKADDSVDYAAIEHNVARWQETSLSGFILNSENGEETFLSEQERLEVIRTVARANENRKLIIGGIDCPSATESLRLGEALVEAGAELLRVRIPRLTDVVGYFNEVIPRAAAPVVIIHQMAPGLFLSTSTGVGAAPEIVADLLARDNVYGYITSADIRFEARVLSLLKADRRFWMGNACILLAGAAMGANGACMMLGNVAPQACHDIMRLAMNGEVAAARDVHNRIMETDWEILSRRAAGLKAALNLQGFQAGAPRSPTPACTKEEIDRIKSAMTSAGLV